jgi:tetratricopeptide (TPR) repeat protein
MRFTGRLTLAVAGTLFLAQCAAAGDETQRFLWEQANTRMLRAAAPEDYIEAAATYQRLLRENIVNPALLNNLGCALVMGGDYANARRAFERAERFAGTTPESAAGIKAAIARSRGESDAEAPWYRTAFFWHFALPARVRAGTALFGWTLLWCGILLLLLRRRAPGGVIAAILPLAETLLFTGSLITLLFGASSLATLIQERSDATHWQTVQFAVSDNLEEL